ncbi:MAG: cheW-like domain protein [Gemmatimonadetes bacterium]|nr:cheW-like domain protein [Gemmatimonadota bacterium]
MSDVARMQRERPLDDEAIASATAHYASLIERPRTDFSSVLVFRLGTEWLAFPTASLDRVADATVVHSLPHRRRGATAGIVNVGGDLVVHVSLAGLLGVESADDASAERRRVVRRLMVLTDARGRLAITVDEVWGVHHYRDDELRAIPPTLARAGTSYTVSMLQVDTHTVGVLDASRVLDALSVAIS